jgi:hypothetical protein
MNVIEIRIYMMKSADEKIDLSSILLRAEVISFDVRMLRLTISNPQKKSP